MLEAAQAINDPTIFYAVFKHLEQRNLRLRGTTEFSKGNKFIIYLVMKLLKFSGTTKCYKNDCNNSFSLMKTLHFLDPI